MRDNLFIIVCSCGYLEIAKWLYKIHFGRIRQFVEFIENPRELDDTHIFATTCAAGQLEVAKWLFKIYNVHIDVRYAIRESCSFGQIEIVKWLYYEIIDALEEIATECPTIATSQKIDLNENDHELFKTACKGGLETLQWVYSQRNYDEEINLETYGTIFERACRFGYMDIVQWIYSIEPRITQYLSGLYFAAKDGYLDIVVWILNTFPPISSDDYHLSCAFRGACSQGHIEIAQLLLDIAPNMDIQSGNYYVFRWACHNGHIDVAKWLYQISPPKHNSCIRGAFDYACSGRHCHIIRWLNDIAHPILVQNDNHGDEILSSICAHGDIYVVQLLFQLFPELFLNISISSVFAMVDGSDNFEYIKWVYAQYPALNESYYNYKIFYRSCKNGNMEIAEWIFQMDPHVLDYINAAKLFYSLCISGELEIAKWIRVLFPQMKLDRAKMASLFTQACQNNAFHVAAYLSGLDERFELVVDQRTERILKWKVNDMYLPIKPTPANVFRQEIEDCECGICYDEPVALRTNCGHLYCLKCTYKWYNVEKTTVPCPYCKTQVFEFYSVKCEV